MKIITIGHMYHIGSHEIDISICMNEHEPIKRFKKTIGHIN